MQLPRFIVNFLRRVAFGAADSREPDFVIGGKDRPYLRRWWLIPRNRVFNIYVHQFLRGDDDRALHDHPWPFLSVMLLGRYVEHTISAGGINRELLVTEGHCRGHIFGSFAHRLELAPLTTCWTMFITGPRYREWGFHCPDIGWVHWEQFTASDDPGGIGRGCAQ